MSVTDFFDLKEDYKNYEPFTITKKNVVANKGKHVFYVLSRYYDRQRGYFSIDSGVLCDMKYSTIYLDDYGAEFNRTDIVAIIIKKGD